LKLSSSEFSSLVSESWNDQKIFAFDIVVLVKCWTFCIARDFHVRRINSYRRLELSIKLDGTSVALNDNALILEIKVY
jgi:hypothetical protein